MINYVNLSHLIMLTNLLQWVNQKIVRWNAKDQDPFGNITNTAKTHENS